MNYQLARKRFKRGVNNNGNNFLCKEWKKDEQN